MTPFYNNTTPGNGKFVVEMNYNSLMDLNRAPHYWIEPPKEDITINLTNVQALRNQSQADPVRLNKIRIEYFGRLLAGTNVSGELPIEVPAEIDGNSTVFTWPGSPAEAKNVTSSINITFPAGYFIPPSAYANITLIKMNVSYYFDPKTVNITQDSKYDYLNASGLTPPSLNPAIMEVRVW
jgi:hypothetical protein